MIDRWIVDNEPSARYPIYTRANVGEVFPEPVAPLSATIGINEQSEPGWRAAFDRFGAFLPSEFDPDNNEIIGVFGGYCYLNVSISRIFGVRTPGLTPQAIDYTLFGEQPGVPPYEPQPTDEDPARTEAIQATLQWVLSASSIPELDEEAAMIADLRTNRPDYGAMSNDELVAWMRHLMGDHFGRLFAQHIFVTYAATVPTGMLQQITTDIGEPTYLLRLIAGVGDVDSAAPSYALWDLGRQVRASASLTDAFAPGVSGADARLRALATTGAAEARAFVEAFDAFLFDFGSRGPNEWEVRSPTWETDPDLALAAVDRMRLASDDESPRLHQHARSDDREALGAQVVESLAGNAEAQAQVSAALAAAKVFLAGRERSKSNAIRLVHEVRMAMYELGRRMVAEGHFEQTNSLGMLRNSELDAFLADPASFRAEVRAREASYAELGEVEPPFVFEGTPPPLPSWPRRADRTATVAVAGDILQGIPGCPGQATGRARVVLDPHDAHTLEPGDVLVAPITDPSWTPLFVGAGGVVVDVGAPLSHAIIVSRELGIPCVVSVTDGTMRIPDGALVTVNGDAGTVTIVES